MYLLFTNSILFGTLTTTQRLFCGKTSFYAIFSCYILVQMYFVHTYIISYSSGSERNFKVYLNHPLAYLNHLLLLWINLWLTESSRLIWIISRIIWIISWLIRRISCLFESSHDLFKVRWFLSQRYVMTSNVPFEKNKMASTLAASMITTWSVHKCKEGGRRKKFKGNRKRCGEETERV